MIEKHLLLAKQVADAIKTAKEIEAAGGNTQAIINGLREDAELIQLRVSSYKQAAAEKAAAEKGGKSNKNQG
jgi:hypothetical protein